MRSVYWFLVGLLVLGEGTISVAMGRQAIAQQQDGKGDGLSVEATAALSEADQLNQQVLQLYQQGKYQEALPLAEKALRLREKYLDPNHPDVALSLNNLAELYRTQGRYSDAEPLFQHSLKILESQLGLNHPDVALSLNNLAELYRVQGRYGDAEPLFQRSLKIWESQLGLNHPNVATSLNNLALLYRVQGRYGDAEPLYQRSLKIRESQLGLNHPNVALSLNNLALLHQDQGRYDDAEPLYQRSLKIRESQLGLNHPDVAASLNNLARLYQAQSRYGDAEPLFRRSLKIWESQLGLNHPDVALSLNNLAELYRAQGRYSDAEPLYQRSLKIWESQLGLNHPDVATSLNNLAGLYQAQGRYGDAEPLYQRSLKILESQLGLNHPDVATSLNNLALLYQTQRRYSDAEPLYQRSLKIRQSQLRLNHPHVATSLNNLAGLYQAQGRYEQTIVSFTKSLEIEERNLTENIALGSEAQKRDYIAQLSGSTGRSISLHLQDQPTNPQAAQLALTTLFRRKGRILDATSLSLATLRQNLTPENQKLLDELADRTSQLAALPYSPLLRTNPTAYRQQLQTLTQEVVDRQAELARRSTTFRQQTQPITIKAIQQQIPQNTTLIEITRYNPFTPKAKASEQWGKPRYAAYLLTRDGTISAIDLGEAAPIDQLADQFRRALRIRNSDIKQIARQLDAALMQPIRAKLGNTKQLLISPDSQLNLIPFAALVDENHRYLVETYDISYLTSGRDLLRLTPDTPRPQPPLILANPNYAQPGDPTATHRLSQPQQTAQTTPDRRTDTRSSDFSPLQFGPLPGTKEEAEAIAPKLPNALLLTDTQATENALKQTRSPRILHIATHGFFLPDLPTPDPNTSRGSRSFDCRSDICPTDAPGFQPPPPRTNTANALLRSGLALAGANSRQSGSEDGILTALEVANLNLRGTQLVVLSACETGLGDVANGEGVYGLRRALVLAGSQSQLISLWKVDDTGTKDLMVQYYDKLLTNQPRSTALRQVQLDFLKSPNYRHPFFWASFIPSGDWRSLNNQP